MNCLLCHSSKTAAFQVIKLPERAYFHCDDCDLIFMNPAQRLSPKEERARYDLHENEDQAGYRAFFAPLIKALEEYKSPLEAKLPLRLLDFGCGPSAFLGSLLEAKGYQVTNYDLFYHPNQEYLAKHYDVVVSTEVWEHLHEPRHDISQMISQLKPGGILAVMTSGHRGESVFHDWHYRRDPTHVVFYSDKTMKWIAQASKLELLIQRSPYWIFRKPLA